MPANSSIWDPGDEFTLAPFNYYPILEGEVNPTDLQYPYGNVLRYGASPANLDNYQEFQNAIDSCVGIGIRAATVPAYDDPYLFNGLNQVRMKGNVSLLGIGGRAQIWNFSSSPTFVLGNYFYNAPLYDGSIDYDTCAAVTVGQSVLTLGTTTQQFLPGEIVMVMSEEYFQFTIGGNPVFLPLWLRSNRVLFQSGTQLVLYHPADEPITGVRVFRADQPTVSYSGVPFYVWYDAEFANIDLLSPNAPWHGLTAGFHTSIHDCSFTAWRGLYMNSQNYCNHYNLVINHARLGGLEFSLNSYMTSVRDSRVTYMPGNTDNAYLMQFGENSKALTLQNCVIDYSAYVGNLTQAGCAILVQSCKDFAMLDCTIKLGPGNGADHIYAIILAGVAGVGSLGTAWLTDRPKLSNVNVYTQGVYSKALGFGFGPAFSFGPNNGQINNLNQYGSSSAPVIVTGAISYLNIDGMYLESGDLVIQNLFVAKQIKGRDIRLLTGRPLFNDPTGIAPGEINNLAAFSRYADFDRCVWGINRLASVHNGAVRRINQSIGSSTDTGNVIWSAPLAGVQRNDSVDPVGYTIKFDAITQGNTYGVQLVLVQDARTVILYNGGVTTTNVLIEFDVELGVNGVNGLGGTAKIYFSTAAAGISIGDTGPGGTGDANYFGSAVVDLQVRAFVVSGGGNYRIQQFTAEPKIYGWNK